jgi:hypothetical protein
MFAASWIRSGQKVLVPTIRMQTLMECIPRDRFPFIDYFLCDAQGSDLDVMRSAGPELRRFRRIEMEVQVNNFAYYQNDNSKASVLKYMESMGFKMVRLPLLLRASFPLACNLTLCGVLMAGADWRTLQRCGCGHTRTRPHHLRGGEHHFRAHLETNAPPHWHARARG